VAGSAGGVRVPWSAHTIVPSKAYTVVGAVVVRDVNDATALVALKERAIAMGGHDIINVRVDRQVARVRIGEEIRTMSIINTATAVVIRYTDEILRGSDH